MSRLAAFAVLLALAPPVEAPPETAFSAFGAESARRFDFAVGEWDAVSLRAKGDGTLEEIGGSPVSVLSILDGKGILEIRYRGPQPGWTLRTYDALRKRWVVWTDEVGPNASRLDRFEGNFRHGRFEARRIPVPPYDPSVVKSRVVSDVTPFSMRWDESVSADAGKRWSVERVREYSRTSVEPHWPIWKSEVKPEPPLCNPNPKSLHELLVGKWKSESSELDMVPILGECALLGALEVDGIPEEMVFLTYDTREERWVTAVLDRDPETGLVLYSGTSGYAEQTAEGGEALHWTVSSKGGGQRKAGAELGYHRGKRYYLLKRVEDQRAAAPSPAG